VPDHLPGPLGAPLAEPLFDCVTLIGIGLIGSSLAHVARRKGLARKIIAFDADAGVSARVRELAIADEVAGSLKSAVRDADLVILCVPVGAMGAIAQEIAPFLRAGAIISDVGSVKCSVLAAVAPHLPPDAGFASLFLHRWCILTPPEMTDPKAVAKLSAFWTGAGANVEVMQPAHHDLVLAITSHVPHLIAYNIVGTAAHLEEVTQSEVIKFSASGFRDFTRIAASDPTMWRDIFLNNKEAVIEMLGRFTEDLIALQRMIRHGDGQGLFDLFTRTRAIRRAIIEQGQDTAAPDFGRRREES